MFQELHYEPNYFSHLYHIKIYQGHNIQQYLTLLILLQARLLKYHLFPFQITRWLNYHFEKTDGEILKFLFLEGDLLVSTILFYFEESYIQHEIHYLLNLEYRILNLRFLILCYYYQLNLQLKHYVVHKDVLWLPKEVQLFPFH